MRGYVMVMFVLYMLGILKMLIDLTFRKSEVRTETYTVADDSLSMFVFGIMAVLTGILLWK